MLVLSRRLAAAAAFAFASLLSLPLHAAPPQGPAYGLIVKLRTPQGREQAKAVGIAAPAADEAGAQRERLNRVLQTQAAALARIAPAGARIARPVGRAHLVQWDQPLAPEQAEQAARALAAHEDVEWVDYNVRERRLDVPNDPEYPGQWWLHPVASGRHGVPGVETAWAQPGSARPVVVAVLDTGALFDHPDLVGTWILPGYDFVTQPVFSGDGDGRDADASDPGDAVTRTDRNANPGAFADCPIEDSSWHGTKIAGQIAARTGNGVGIAGVNGRVRILPVRVAGKCGALVQDIVDGILWAAGIEVAGVPPNPNPAKVINLSFGGPGPCSASYQDAIDAIRAKGAVLVAAAGNEGGQVSRPANCKGVVGVGALNRNGFKATYSNFGPEITISTVGGDPTGLGACGRLLGDPGLLTTANAGTGAPGAHVYDEVAGTSFAAPVVAGVISLMQSAASADLSPDQIVEGLKRSARPHVRSDDLGTCSSTNVGRCQCTTGTCGAGILDAEQAVRYALDPGSYTPPSRQVVRVDNADTAACRELTRHDGGDGGSGDEDDGGGGGGALGWGWLAALGLVVIATAGARPRRRQPA